MKQFRYIFMLAALILAADSCQKFDELEADPNRSTQVPPSLVLRGILVDMNYAPWGDISRWNQYWCSNYNYYDNNEYWTGSADLRFTTLKNVIRMEEEAQRINLPVVNAYSALGKFFRAFFYYDMTMKVGDIPMNQALLGAENVAPAYDTQKDVLKQVLVWLDEANTDLAARIAASDVSLEGDIYFGGDLRKWQKTVNAFKLRVLVQLSKKSADADLNVKGEFSKVLGNLTAYPVMESNGDNLQFIYGSVFNKYPFNPDNFGFYADRYNTAGTYINTLAALRDPRVYVVAEPAAAKLAAGFTATDFESYIGAPSDEGLDEMATKVQAGEYSRINKARFFSNYVGEPSIQIGFPELCFNIAEAINRGWATGNAGEWYNKGITASMETYGITDVAPYLAQSQVAYAGNNASGLTQVLVQKYLAQAQHSGLESYYTWRRTGVPAFAEGGPGTGNSGVIPRRFQYPTSERDNNTDNYQAALSRQFGNTTDNINDKLWIEKD
jgi:hypothetical protein